MTPTFEKTPSIEISEKTPPVETTLTASTGDIPPAGWRPGTIACLPTPSIPHSNLNNTSSNALRYCFYVVFEARAVRSEKRFSRKVTFDWSPLAAKITTLAASSSASHDPNDSYSSRRSKMTKFMEMDSKARELWHYFVDEMQGRKEFEGKILLMTDFKAMKKDKFVVKVETVNAPQNPL